ncbi:MAG: hypothetical protein J2P54_25070 [Bradyrhizobiaceae bacterium]|nr:hypothetical protein [Bradyrhizobiaceae bacterium]
MRLLLVAFFLGIAGTLAWQSYGDAARGMIASSYPQLGWLAPQSADVKTTPATIVQPTSPDPEDLKAISLELTSMRQRIDEIAASQDQIIRDVNAKLQLAKQEILDKISTPSPELATAPSRNPTLPAPRVAPVH